MKGPARLIAVDGVNGASLMAAARELRADGRKRAGLSEWDASGVFGDLGECDAEDAPSARVLLLLYATDLAFRLRWEIRPALEEGRVVIAAPYVDTAIAFGRAAGLRGNWLATLFNFAPPADLNQVASARHATGDHGFVEFGCERIANARAGLSRHRLMERTARFLKKSNGHRGTR